MSAASDLREAPMRLSTPRVWVVTETTAPLRYGWDGKRLIVARPGTPSVHRRLLWLDRNLPLIAGVALLFVLLTFRPQAPSVGIILAIIPILAGIIAVRRSTQLLRADLRILTVASVDVDNSHQGTSSRRLFRDCVEELRNMERDLRRNRITPVEFERRWHDVYEALPSHRLRK